MGISRRSTSTKDYNDAIGGRAYYLGRIELELPVSSSIKSLGLRPSALCRYWLPVEHYGRRRLNRCCLPSVRPMRARPDLSSFNSSKPDCSIDEATGQAPPAGAAFVCCNSGIQGIFPRQFAKAPTFDRHRRQLDFTFRSAPPRSRQGSLLHQKGDDHETLHFQRRNSILMKTLLISAAFAAAVAGSLDCAAHRPFPPPSLQSSTSTVSPTNATRAGPLRPRSSSQVSSFESRRGTLATHAADRSRNRSRRRSMH